MWNLFSLDGKAAVVTGGLGMLGRQFVNALAGHGAKVAVIDRANPASNPFRGDGVRVFTADITKRGELEHALEKIEQDWGTPEILINNAAIDAPPSAPSSENGPFESYPEGSLDAMLDVNIKGTVLCCQVFGGAMAKKGKGSIVNISSIYGVVSPVQEIYEYKRRQGQDWYKPVGYSITKSAVLNLTRYLATYWAKQGVRVNTLTPAGIFNDQDPAFLEEYVKRVPVGRMAHPHELNGAIIFLASDASSYVTGSNLVVDGGWTAW